MFQARHTQENTLFACLLSRWKVREKRTGEMPRPLKEDSVKFSSDRLDVSRFLALTSLSDHKLDTLSFFQASITLSRDIGVMDKDITTPSIDGDETKTFCVVEPLNDTGAERIGHSFALTFYCGCSLISTHGSIANKKGFTSTTSID